jgi:hypothetical protein
MLRDFRINRIFEGSSEIMRLFIAREAVDHHFRLAFDLVNPEASLQARFRAFAASARFHPLWYVGTWMGSSKSYAEFGPLARHLRWVERATRRLGRSVFHAMLRFGPKLEKKQSVLFRAVDIGAELFAMSAACVRAQMLATQGNREARVLADVFCRQSRERVQERFRALFGAHDDATYALARQVLDGRHAWLEEGIIPSWPAGDGDAGTGGADPAARTARAEAAGVGD